MKELKQMSEKELKELLKKVREEDRKIEEAIKNNEKIKQLEKEYDEIGKQLKKVRKEIEKRDKSKLVTTDGMYPSFYYSEWGKEHNIRDEIFEAIKKSGFRISKLKDTQITNFARYVQNRLEKEDKKLQELIKTEVELREKQNEIFDKQMKIEKEIREKLEKIPYSEWEIENELKKREETKKHPEKAKERKQIEDERERFNRSFDRIYEEFKKLIKRRSGL